MKSCIDTVNSTSTSSLPCLVKINLGYQLAYHSPPSQKSTSPHNETVGRISLNLYIVSLLLEKQSCAWYEMQACTLWLKRNMLPTTRSSLSIGLLKWLYICFKSSLKCLLSFTSLCLCNLLLDATRFQQKY